VFALHQNTV